ncbi:MAG: ABC transporter ATP-binding protein, partial [Bacilli bacterium]
RKISQEVLWEEHEKKEYRYFVEHEVGEIQNLISEISYAARSLQYESLQIVIKSIIMVTIYTIMLGGYSAATAILYFIGYMSYFFISFFISKNNSKGITSVLNSSGKINSFIIDYYRNIESIISSYSADYENNKFNDMLEDERISYYRLQNHIDLSFLLQQLLLVIITVLVFSSSIVLKYSNNIFIEILLILVYSAFNLSDTGKDFLALMETKDRLKVGLNEIEFGKNSKRNTTVNSIPIHSANSKEIVLINNISFSYGEHFQMNNVCMKVNDNDKIAIVGKNGCGKSTLLKIIAGLISPTQGDVKFHLKQIKKLSDIKYYSQNTVLFDRSVLENILYPKKDYDLKEVKSLIKKLHLDSLIQNEDDLLTKRPGDFGSKFSGGEKQKILIARSIVNKSPLILFDEIDAALDSKTEKIFNDLLKTEFKDSSVICVTHKNVRGDIYNKIYDLEKKCFIKEDLS